MYLVGKGSFPVVSSDQSDALYPQNLPGIGLSIASGYGNDAARGYDTRGLLY
jgi:hypothetical protein